MESIPRENLTTLFTKVVCCQICLNGCRYFFEVGIYVFNIAQDWTRSTSNPRGHGQEDRSEAKHVDFMDTVPNYSMFLRIQFLSLSESRRNLGSF